MAYALASLGALVTALAYGAHDVTYVFTGHTAACLIVLAVGCHVWLRRRGEALFRGAGRAAR